MQPASEQGSPLRGGAGELCSGVSFANARTRQFLPSVKKPSGWFTPQSFTSQKPFLMLPVCSVIAHVSDVFEAMLALCLSTGSKLGHVSLPLKPAVLTVRLKIISTSLILTAEAMSDLLCQLTWYGQS